MVDPIVSSAGKAGTEMFKEASKQMQNASEQISKFEELRQKMEAQEVSSPAAQKSGMEKASADNLQAQQAQEVQAPQNANAVGDVQKLGEIPKVTDMQGLEKVVNRLKSGQDRLNSLINESLSGKSFTPQEMLALQAEVSQITSEIQLCTEIVKSGLGSVKQVMSTQV